MTLFAMSHIPSWPHRHDGTLHPSVWVSAWYEDERSGSRTYRERRGRILHVEYSTHLVRRWITEDGALGGPGITLEQLLGVPEDFAVCPKCLFGRPGLESDRDLWRREILDAAERWRRGHG